ncbi:MAG TPA: helix-turn-helix transcriptional regulator [Gemmataceae bacterium]|nr:helix-turn-helix transcriptional regulator [Gemmataceae bacterium]
MAPVTPPTSAGRPAADEVYDRFIREHLQAARLGPGFVKGVVKRFRSGPTLLCSKAIGQWLNRRLRQAGWTQQDLAGRIGVDRSAVAYWIRGGSITLDNLSAVLLEFEAQWAELPIPARQELAVAAYLAALPYAREHLAPKTPAKVLDREAFWALYHLFAEPHWERAVREQDPELLHREAARVRAGVKMSLGTEPAGALDVSALRQLVREWGAAWLVCVGQLPTRWAVQ